jgi:hypothetical protein
MTWTDLIMCINFINLFRELSLSNNFSYNDD